jgi:hypothetical protein
MTSTGLLFKVLSVLALLIAFQSSASADPCTYPGKLKDGRALLPTDESRSTCLATAAFSTEGEGFLPLTPEELKLGPTTLKIKTDPLHCTYYPMPKGAGLSLKFFCMITDENGTLYSSKQELVPQAVGFNADLQLLDSSGQVVSDADGKAIKGLLLKVKYVSEAGTFKVQKRYREVFTEVASTRILWALGLSADSVYQISKVICKGCTKDPYTANQTETATETNTFLNAGVEYRLGGKAIERKSDEGFSLAELEAGVKDGSSEKQLEHQIFLAAASIINHHNTSSTRQNTLKCPPSAQNSATLECSRPVALFDDVGSTFGGKKRFLWDDHPRGDYSKFKKHSALKDCQFAVKGPTITNLTPAGQSEFIRRSANLTPEHVQAIAAGARLDLMDEKNAGTGKKALKNWSDKISSLVNEIKTAKCN